MDSNKLRVYSYKESMKKNQGIVVFRISIGRMNVPKIS